MSIYRQPFEHHDYRGALDSGLVYYLLRKYGTPNCHVFDQFPGGTSTQDICKVLGFECKHTNFPIEIGQHITSVGEATQDIVLSHPPYWNALHYTDDPQDLCNYKTYDGFMVEIEHSLIEAERILKTGGFLLFILGDIRRDKRLYLAHADAYQIVKEKCRNLVLRDDLLWELTATCTPMISTKWLIMFNHCLVFEKIGHDLEKEFQ